MHLIVYMSEYVGRPDEIQNTIEDITKVAVRENKIHGITGVLVYLEGKFLQAIEGDEKELIQLLDNIKRDKRHQNVEYLIDTPIERRSFSDWHMDSLLLGHNQTFDKKTVKKLTQSFEENFLPRADILFYFYKALLKESAS